MNTKKLTSLAMLLGIALVIFVAESQLPPLAPIPGIKLGLANIVTLIVMVWYGRKESLLVLILRIIIGSIFCGQPSVFFYSLAGGMVCFLVMAIALGLLGSQRLWVVSVLGAVSHNAGQLGVAYLFTKTFEVFYYFPILVLSGIITGIFTGVAAQTLINSQLRNFFRN